MPVPMHYTLIIAWSEEDGAFVVSVPELPGCQTHGATYQEAARNAELAIQAWLDAAEALHRPIPAPQPPAVR